MARGTKCQVQYPGARGDETNLVVGHWHGLQTKPSLGLKGWSLYCASQSSALDCEKPWIVSTGH